MHRPQIIGVLNVTPDSFYDGGQLPSVESAVARAGQMLADGADILEVGGESTGPGSSEVSADEELRRVVPVIEAIRRTFPDAALSVDTYKSPVALAALERGAIMINDVTAGRGDSTMFATLARFPAASLVLMYAKDPTPRTTIEPRQYDDVISTIKQFLSQRKEAATAAGVAAARITLDPGLGHFVSGDPRYSFEILRRLPELLALGSPLLLSPSRKSFLAGPENLPVAGRLPGTIAASALAVAQGAAFIRTHDVLEVRRGCQIAYLTTTPPTRTARSPRSAG